MFTLGLSMIVRNAEKELRPCLESARPLVDQIVIADTGSTDRTREIAAEFGATIISFPWNDNFADARNAALAPVTTDWVLVLDADEELAPEAIGALPALLRRGQDVGGYRVTIRNYIPHRFCLEYDQLSRVNHDDVPRAKGAPAWTQHTMIRLFRRHPEIFFRGRIHETVDQQIKKAGLPIILADFRILHFGRLNAERMGGKKVYYPELLQRKTLDEPDDALTWLQLGCEQLAAGHEAEALDSMQRSFALHPWALTQIGIARTHSQYRRPEQALQALDRVPDQGDFGLLRNEMRGDLLHDLGRLKEARKAYQLALRFSPARRGGAETGREPLIESKLGYTEVRLGVVRTGLARLRRAVHKVPTVLENHDRLVKACILASRDAEAADAAECILNYFYSEKMYLRAAALNSRIERKERAKQSLVEGLRRLPGAIGLQKMLAELESTVGPTSPIAKVAPSARQEDAWSELA
jgi:tetratricopeptide (TPR) repeat protein